MIEKYICDRICSTIKLNRESKFAHVQPEELDGKNITVLCQGWNLSI